MIPFDSPRIIATLGPSCSEARILASMIEAGVDVFRINFSQCSLEEHAVYLHALGEARRLAGRAAAVVGDLCGPRFRVGRIEPDGQELRQGVRLTIAADCPIGPASRFGTNYDHFTQDVAVGDPVLIDEGRLVLRVIDKVADEVRCEVVRGGRLHSRKGINLPNTHLSAASVTDEDWRAVHWAVEQGLEYLALSFVRSAGDIEVLRDGLKGSSVKIVAKVETRQALSQLEPIVQASDAVLLARGDLGVEVDPATIPIVQRQLGPLCRRLDRPWWVATHILHSMIANPVPTRAEVSDVATAIWDGADGLVLTGETAMGHHPIEVVQILRRIIATVAQ